MVLAKCRRLHDAWEGYTTYCTRRPWRGGATFNCEAPAPRLQQRHKDMHPTELCHIACAVRRIRQHDTRNPHAAAGSSARGKYALS